MGTGSSASLAGRRVLVVGASAGIGRATAIGAVRRGARVALAARRADALTAAVADAGGGHAVVGDVTEASECQRIVEETARALGGIDLLVYSVGSAPLQWMRHTTPEEWAQAVSTNAIAASQLIRAALAHLEPAAIVAALSSETVDQPRTGLGAYGASKAALEAAMRSWRLEQPEVRFTCAAIGPTLPTEFGDGYREDVLVDALLDWSRRGMLQEYSMRTEHVADVLLDTLAVALRHPDVGVESLRLRSPARAAPPTTDVAEAVTWAATLLDPAT